MFKDSATFGEITQMANDPSTNSPIGMSLEQYNQNQAIGGANLTKVEMFPGSGYVICKDPIFTSQADFANFMKSNNFTFGTSGENPDDTGLFGMGKYFDYAVFAVAGGLITYLITQ